MPPKKAKTVGNSAGPKGTGKKAESSPTDVETPGPPEDILPLVLTSATQELFGCRADEDVTGANPYKLLHKDDIVQDMKTRAAVSDFSPVKQIVLDYPEEEILVVYDRDLTYGQSFYLVLTPEAKDRILKPPEPEVLEPEVLKTPEPTPWISLGSEQEIERESMKETREKLCIKFSRPRREFGKPVCFSDWSAADEKDGFIKCPSYTDSRFSMKLMQRDCGMQAVPRLQSSGAQTEWKLKENKCSQHEPRELSDAERDRVLHSQGLKELPHLSHSQQAEITNVFVDDWKTLAATADDDDDSYDRISEDLILFRAFANKEHTMEKKISCINWHPTIHGVIAVALTAKKEEHVNEATTCDTKPSLILFYSFTHPSDPQLLLQCPDDISAFDFCPSDPNIIVGGCVNGQVVLWDISAYVTHLQGTQSVNADTFDLEDNKERKTPAVHYCAESSIDYSHKAPITDVHWLPPTFEVSRTGVAVKNKQNVSVQVVTCSPDCSILFWDVRVSRRWSHSASARKQKANQTSPLSSYYVPDTFKHLDRTWEPMFKVSLPNMNSYGEYAPLKFSLENYTCDNREEADVAADSSEVVPDFRQLHVPSAQELTTLEDVNTKFYIGTEDGEIVYTDWKLVKDDSGEIQSATPLQAASVHHWFVNTVQRSPFFKDIILTVGAWNFAIWREGVTVGPIIKSPYSEQMYTVGCWSLSRPAVFFIGKDDGSIEVWNLLEKTGEPFQDCKHVNKARISCIKPYSRASKLHFLAVSDDLGVVNVFKLPENLHAASKSESLRVRKYFEREEAALKDFLRREERWTKEKQEAEVKKKTEPENPVQAEDDSKAYAEYLKLEESVLKSLGLWQAKAEAQAETQ